MVERFNVCPYARGAREADAVRRAVVLDVADPMNAALGAIDPWIGDERVEVAMLIFPRLEVGAQEFDRFVAELRVLEDRRRGGRSPFVMAAFHPQPRYSTATPAQMTMFFRQSPDPTVQLVRSSVLDAVRGSNTGATRMITDFSVAALTALAQQNVSKPVSDRITEENHRRALAGERHEIDLILEDIRADRAATYGKLSIATPELLR